jgi:hypothetical protein
MGSLIYEIAPELQVRDRALRHLQQVMMSKLRRHESFCFAWDDEPDVGIDESEQSEGNGRHGAVWVSASSSLYFTFDGPLTEQMNLAWLDLLTRTASISGTLRMLPEPDAPRREPLG